MFTNTLTGTLRSLDDLTAVDLARVTADDYSALCDLAGRNGAVHAAGCEGDVAHDALFLLADVLRAAENWTAVASDASGTVTDWLNEDFGAVPMPISRATVLRWAVDAAADNYGLGVDAVADEPVSLPLAA